MNARLNEVKEIASTLLAAMLSNPHIYSQTSVEGGEGQMEQKLIILATNMADSLIQHVEQIYENADNR
jgi:hypothetical protein